MPGLDDRHSPPPASTDPAALGQRLRDLRLARGWTLEAAAAAIGLSRSAISKIERGDVAPSFDALLKLAGGFQVDVNRLLTADRPTAGQGRRSIVRAGKGRRHDMAHYAVRMLQGDIEQPAFIPYEFTVKATSPDQFDDWDRHDSDDFIYVLSGTMVLHTEDQAPVRLRTGDSIYFDARVGHRLVCAEGDAPAHGLCVSAPGRGR